MARFKNYKTALCRNFGKKGCGLGDECRFAHGAAELVSSSTQNTGRASSKSGFSAGKPPRVAQYSLDARVSENVLWEHEDAEGVWVAFGRTDAEALERRYRDGNAYIPLGRECYFVDFSLMLCVNANTMEVIRIRRNPPFPEQLPVSATRAPPGLDEIGAPKEVRKLKSVFCRFFLQERCARGDKCLFAHSEEERSRAQAEAKRGAAPRRKTGLCSFVDCLKGDGCSYAHSPEEIVNYKQKQCKLFAIGRCAHGSRCAFAHGEHEQSQKV